MRDLSADVAQALALNPGLSTAQMAQSLNVSEGAVVAALPGGMSQLLPLSALDDLMADLPEWGPVTTILLVGGSVFEFKGPFPKGRYGHGYYNLMGQHGFEGHLKLDNVGAVHLVSRAHRGQESHSFQFFSHDGALIFKVFLGRDRARQLLPEQLARFAHYLSLCQSETNES